MSQCTHQRIHTVHLILDVAAVQNPKTTQHTLKKGSRSHSSKVLQALVQFILIAQGFAIIHQIRLDVVLVEFSWRQLQIDKIHVKRAS